MNISEPLPSGSEPFSYGQPAPLPGTTPLSPDIAASAQGGGVILHVQCRPPGFFPDALEDNLRRSGWRVHGLLAHALTDAAVSEQAPDVVLLSGDAEHADSVIALLRHLQAHHWPALRVALLGGASAFLRIQALQAGADLCCSPEGSNDWTAAELIAIFERWRSASAARARPSRWRICASSRYLYGPGAVRVPLTAAEGLFMSRLLAAPNQRLARTGGAEGSRGDDVTVARLRNKARQLGVDLPVCAVRNWGYLFLDEA